MPNLHDARCISEHLARFWRVMRTRQEWMRAQEIWEQARIGSRTARQYALQLTTLGLLERLEVFPGYRYRLSPGAATRHPELYERLELVTNELLSES